MKSFPLQDVRLTQGVLKHAQETNTVNLLKYDVDRLLAPYRKEAGLPAKAGSFPCWIGLDGHIGGHYLTALACNYAATGNQACKERLLYVISEIKACQQAHQNGYAGGVPNSGKIWPALAHGDFSQIKKAWVPWYNLHKMYAGLRDAWLYAGEESARDMFLSFCDWGVELTSHLDDGQMEQMLHTEHGGMNEMFADAFAMTGNEKYLLTARRFSHKKLLNDLMRGIDNLDNMHANTQIPKAIGFMRIGEVAQDRSYTNAARFFWESVALKRSIAIGGNSIREFFPSTQACGKYVEEREGPESCNTYNMLKLTQGLFRQNPQAFYADFYERALFNHILSTQHPEHGGYVYFTPVRPRHYRVYSDANKGMWCCVGSGMENPTKYGEFIYTHRRDSLYVNLFIGSELHWREKNMTIQQQTDFPFQEGSKLILSMEKPGRFTLLVRHPYWVGAKQFKVKCNGKIIESKSIPSSYVAITREWKDGDVVEVLLPMSTRLEELPNVPQYVAIMHGPVLLGAKTGVEDLAGLVASDDRWGHIAHGKLLPISKAPVLVGKDIKGKLRPLKGQPLHFRTKNLFHDPKNDDLVLQPFFQIHDARYMMYWLSLSKEEYKQMTDSLASLEKQRLELDARVVDAIVVGEQQPEADHQMAMDKTSSGLFKDAFYRMVHDGGYLTYQLHPGKENNLKLLMRYWGDEGGNRSFKIYVDGTLVAAENISGKWRKEAFVDVEYSLPVALFYGKQQVELKVVPEKGHAAGGIYYIALVR